MWPRAGDCAEQAWKKVLPPAWGQHWNLSREPPSGNPRRLLFGGTCLLVHMDGGRTFGRSFSDRGVMLGQPVGISRRIRREQHFRVTMLAHRIDQQAKGDTDQHHASDPGTP